MTQSRTPRGIFALTIFFAAATVISGLSAVSLATPGGPLEPLWVINPRARAGFEAMGPWAIGLLAAVCGWCAFTFWGLASHDRRGYLAAVAVLGANLAGDLFAGLSGAEPRALIGAPIVVAILAYLLSSPVRAYFGLIHRPAESTDSRRTTL